MAVSSIFGHTVRAYVVPGPAGYAGAHEARKISTNPEFFAPRPGPWRCDNVPPDRTLLEVLREDLHLTATKEGCGEGDCGACTVVLGEAVDGQLEYKAINSCIRLAHSVDGMAVWTAEDMASRQTASCIPRRKPWCSATAASAAFARRALS